MPNLKKLTTAQLWEEFRKAFQLTAERLLHLATIWVELEERGEDLSNYRNPMLSFLPDVASGKLLPEVLLRYGSSAAIVQVVASLVPEDQKKLVRPDAKVNVAQHDGSTRQARIEDLRQAELRQVLGDGRIRTLKEQKGHMAPPPRVIGPRIVSRAVNDTDWDLEHVLSDAQKMRLTQLADDAGLSPAEFAAEAMVRFNIIPGKAPSRRASRQDSIGLSL